MSENERLWESIPSSSEEHRELVAKCQDNMWIKEHGASFEDAPFFEADSPYSFVRTDSVEGLRKYFEHGNWAIRNGILYDDLLFVNQVNGGDEWWTLKYDKSKCEYVAFESVTFQYIIERGEFEEYIGRLEKATIEQLVALDY